jgi:predicted ATPase
MLPLGFISFIELRAERVPASSAYPFSVPAVSALQNRLALGAGATLFTGENGCGKSTVLEALALAAGFNPEGGSRNFNFSTRPSESILHQSLRLARTERRPRTGFFLRAESFFNVATNVENLDRDQILGRPIIESYGGKSLHEQSHGESFLALVKHRFGPEGLYILDEPEAALSVRHQIELLRELGEHVTKRRSQLIVATHSPILMALPGAIIYRFGSDGINQVSYRQTEAFCLMQDFIAAQASLD